VLYCRDKKEILHYFPLKHLLDITPPPHPYIRPTTTTHDLFYRNHGSNIEVNKIIPIVKHYEICEQTYNDLKPNIENTSTPYSEFFNNKVTLVFNAIERNGIHINKSEFETHFYPIENDFVYTQYNLKTTTTRPSNKFNGVNYAALNKENGCRKSFIPRNDKFVELDVKSMHVVILSKLIDYKINAKDIYEYLGEMYGLQRQEAKILTLKQINSNALEEYKDLEFFQKIASYKKNLWRKYENQGYIECPTSGYKLCKQNHSNMNPGKLLNYLLQCLETSLQVNILWEIIRKLKNLDSKIVLYVYDSILLDIKEEEKNQVIDLIEDIYKKYGFNLNYKEGIDYGFLVSP
jgi:hypothetical protein